MSRMTIELRDCEQMLLREIADQRMTQASVGLTYAMAICSSECRTIDWPVVNRAIMDRWPRGGLMRVKKFAQKRLREP